MALGLLAAYRTVQSDFNVHRLTTQFFRPGAKQKTIAFEVMRSSDANNNAARIVFVSQESIRLAIVTVDFIRRPILDGLSLNYQPRFPEGIETPDDKLDSLKFLGKGFVHGYSLPRIMSEYLGQLVPRSSCLLLQDLTRTILKTTKPGSGLNAAEYRPIQVVQCIMQALLFSQIPSP